MRKEFQELNCLSVSSCKEISILKITLKPRLEALKMLYLKDVGYCMCGTY